MGLCRSAASASLRSCSSAGSLIFLAAISCLKSANAAPGSENKRGRVSECFDCAPLAEDVFGIMPNNPRTTKVSTLVNSLFLGTLSISDFVRIHRCTENLKQGIPGRGCVGRKASYNSATRIPEKTMLQVQEFHLSPLEPGKFAKRPVRRPSTGYIDFSS